jgi:hypothetical protein
MLIEMDGGRHFYGARGRSLGTHPIWGVEQVYFTADLKARIFAKRGLVPLSRDLNGAWLSLGRGFVLHLNFGGEAWAFYSDELTSNQRQEVRKRLLRFRARNERSARAAKLILPWLNSAKAEVGEAVQLAESHSQARGVGPTEKARQDDPSASQMAIQCLGDIGAGSVDMVKSVAVGLWSTLWLGLTDPVQLWENAKAQFEKTVEFIRGMRQELEAQLSVFRSLSLGKKAEVLCRLVGEAASSALLGMGAKAALARLGRATIQNSLIRDIQTSSDMRTAKRVLKDQGVRIGEEIDGTFRIVGNQSTEIGRLVAEAERLSTGVFVSGAATLSGDTLGFFTVLEGRRSIVLKSCPRCGIDRAVLSHELVHARTAQLAQERLSVGEIEPRSARVFELQGPPRHGREIAQLEGDENMGSYFENRQLDESRAWLVSTREAIESMKAGRSSPAPAINTAAVLHSILQRERMEFAAAFAARSRGRVLQDRHSDGEVAAWHTIDFSDARGLPRSLRIRLPEGQVAWPQEAVDRFFRDWDMEMQSTDREFHRLIQEYKKTRQSSDEPDQPRNPQE